METLWTLVLIFQLEHGDHLVVDARASDLEECASYGLVLKSQVPDLRFVCRDDIEDIVYLDTELEGNPA